MVLRTSDQRVVGRGVTSGAGDFAVGLVPGSYFLYLIDPTSAHAPGLFGSPTVLTVPAGAMVDADPQMAATHGSIAGAVVDARTGAPLAGVWAVVLNGSSGAPETAATTDGSGHFTIGGLAIGNHLVAYLDPTGAHAAAFHSGAADATTATPVAVAPGPPRAFRPVWCRGSSPLRER